MTLQIKNLQLSARLSADTLELVNNCFQQLQESKGIVFATQHEAIQALCADWLERSQVNSSENTVELQPNQKVIDVPEGFFDSVMEVAEYNKIDQALPVDKLYGQVFILSVSNQVASQRNPKTVFYPETLKALREFGQADLLNEARYNELVRTAISSASLDSEVFDEQTIQELRLFTGSHVVNEMSYNEMTRSAIAAAGTAKTESTEVDPNDVVVHLTEDQNKVLSYANGVRNDYIVELNEDRIPEKHIPAEELGDTLRNCFFNPPYLYDIYDDFLTGITKS